MFVALTNAEDVEAEATVDRFVDQLVRHTIKSNMACQRHSTDSFTLKEQELTTINQLNNFALKNLSETLYTYS